MSRFIQVLLVFVTLFLTGCGAIRNWRDNGFKVGPDYRKPIVKTSEHWIDHNETSINTVSDESGYQEWWQVFNDPTLDELIQTAYQQNLTLRTAALRVLEARAELQISELNLFPQSQQSAGQYARNQASRNTANFIPGFQQRSFDDWSVGFDLSWELDIWGKIRRTIEAQESFLDSEIEAYDDLLVTLIGDIAATYIELRSFDQRILLAESNVEIQNGSLNLARIRFQEGVVSELDVQQAISNRADTEALIPSLRQARRQAVNRLAVLMGMTPTELQPVLIDRCSMPTPPTEVVVGIPAELLRRRPDIRNAERLVAAQCALIGVQEAELYPSFGLNGELSLNADSFSDLFSSGSTAGAFVPGFQWNIFNYGRLRRSVRIEELKFQQAVLDYESSVLVAHQEVEDAMIQYIESTKRVEKLIESVEAAKKSVELVRAQYREGDVDFGQVFVVESSLVDRQDQLVSTQADVATGLVQLYKALGGGWQIRLDGPYCGQRDLKVYCIEKDQLLQNTSAIKSDQPAFEN